MAQMVLLTDPFSGVTVGGMRHVNMCLFGKPLVSRLMILKVPKSKQECNTVQIKLQTQETN